MVGIFLHLCRLGDTRPSGGYSLTPFLKGDGSAPLLGGVLGDGGGLPRDHDRVVLVLVAVPKLLGHQILLHARTRLRVDKFECTGLVPVNQTIVSRGVCNMYSNLDINL